jgi:hypothetical protein
LQDPAAEIPADSRWRRRVPFAFLAAVALFFLMDSLLWRSERWLRFVDRYAPHWRSDSLVTAAIRLLPRDEAAPPILLLGSSQIREGLDCASRRSVSSSVEALPPRCRFASGWISARPSP